MSNVNATATRTGLEIAVIGMAGRFPGSRNLEEFWENLKNGTEAITYFNDEELKEAGVSTEWIDNPNYVKGWGVLEGTEFFDTSFFGYTPLEAELMDPQTRLLHEYVFSALEDAGYDPYTGKELIGLYAGASANVSWQVRVQMSGKTGIMGWFASRQFHDKDYMCTLAAHRLNLTGPVVAVDTACSTSLVAIHFACQGLLGGDCDMAVAGGVSAWTPNDRGYLYREGMLHSPDGHCRAFDAEAKGTNFGSGVGFVVLKRLEEALEKDDNIYAVIKGSSINNDGSNKAGGYTAPSVEGQAQVISNALKMAEVDLETIAFIETHGTGTPIGDPVEVEGLKLAFKTNKRQFCRIGSVKTNVGHLEAASGVAGFIKTVLAVKHQLIPPSLYFKTPNPKIDFENSPFYVNTELTEWKRDKFPLRAGVSSFGIGGTNAHVILEEAPIAQSAERQALSAGREYQLILLSAKTQSALDQMTENLAEYLKKNPRVNLADAAYTLQEGKKAFKYRKMISCANRDEAIEALSSSAKGKVHSYSLKDENVPVVFMFPGLGSQYVNMGKELYQKESRFQQEMDHCFEILSTLWDYDIKEILYPSGQKLGETPENFSGTSSQMKDIEIAQLIIFIFEYSLAKLLIQWGIKPGSMIGYSFGEYVCACISGVFSLEDALKIILYRGQLIREIPQGTMLSVPAPQDEIESLLPHDIAIAIDNGLSCIVSGSKESVDAFEEQLKKKKYVCMRLETSHAIHSPMMEPLLKKFAERLTQVRLNKPQIPYISNVTGQWITPEEATTPDYWCRHMRETVRFAPGVKQLVKEPGSVFVEIGPGQDLSALVLRYMEDNSHHQVINLVRNSKRKVSDVYYLLDRIGRLWLHGIKIDWPGFYQDERRRRVSLPPYPFARDHYWIEEVLPEEDFPKASKQAEPGRMSDTADWFYLYQWERSQFLPAHPIKIPAQSLRLVFVNQLNFSSQLVKRLNTDARELILVEMGDSFSKQGERKYTINPRQSDDYHRLMAELQRENRSPLEIIHLWNLSGGEDEEPGRGMIENIQDYGLYSLLYLVQAIGREDFNEIINIYIVSNSIHEVIGNEELSPGKATILGLAKIVQQEFVNINCRCIDIVLPGSHSPQEEILVQQLAEEFSLESSDTIIAYRGSYRWVESFKPVRLEEVEGDIPRLKEKGVYLITGGLGNIGFVLSQYLARTYKARLILTGRTILPPRREWENNGSHLGTPGKKDSVSKKISRIVELEKLGGEVLAFGVDAADKKQMQKVINEAEAKFGTINGIIHAAGILDREVLKPVEMLKKEDFQQQFQAKIYGLLVLEELFRDRELDFCLLISSLSPILGGLRLASYASANIFMDAFVYQFNRDHRTPWMTINWGDWEFEKKNNKRTTSFGASMNEMVMSPEEGVETFRRILKYCRVNQLVVSAAELQSRISKWVKLESQQEEEGNKKKKSFSLKQRPDLLEPYAPPRNPVEETLAHIMSNMFGFEKIGIHDNFFELGGDSLKLLQAAARIREAGYKFDIKDFVDNQTIAEMAQLVEPAKQTQQADQSLITGIVPLTPIQEAFFQMYGINRQHHNYNNQALILYFKERLDEKTVKDIFQKILTYHDALRITFKKENGNIQQINQGIDHSLSIQIHDLTGHKNTEKMLEDKADEMRSAIALETNSLIGIALFHLDDGDRLLIVIHHLLIDNISWHILLEDLELLYQQNKKGEKFELPPKSDSFKNWSEKLSGYANSKEFLKEKTFWKKLESSSSMVSGIKKDFAHEDKNIIDTSYLSFSLSEEETTNLLTKANYPFGTVTTDILLTALGLGIKKIYGYNRLLIALEGNTRENILADVDIKRTIGCFTWVYPVILDISYENDLSRQVVEVKENLRQYPNKGIGYGILKYSTSGENKPELQLQLNPRIHFSYWGQFDADPGQRSFEISKQWWTNILNLTGQGQNDLDITGVIINKQLVIFITYNKKLYKPETMEVLLTNYQEKLSHLISYCLKQKRKELTPGDLTYKKLSINELNRLKERYSIEDIYTLTPMQEGMFFHALYDPSSAAYIEQKCFCLNGELDIPCVEKSINELFKRYDIFRTAFVQDGFDRPLQVVLKDRQVDFLYKNITHILAPGERETVIKNFKEKDRNSVFDLGQDVLMRVTVLQADQAEYEFIWTYHHILMDGWCIGIIISEFFEIYHSYIQDRMYQLPEVKPYRTYIQWLEMQDKDASKHYWKKYLENYKEVVGVKTMNNPEAIEPGFRLDLYSCQLEREKTIQLEQLAERNRASLNAIIRLVWGIILSKYNGKPDVVFGAVVSGRPPEIKGVRSMIGLFINTIPVRIQLDDNMKFNDLLRRVQKEIIESQPHHYYPLANIQSESLIKQHLFDNFITFDQYSSLEGVIEEDGKDEDRGIFKISKKEAFVQSNYDLNLIVNVHEKVEMEIKYNVNIIDAAIIKKIALHIEEIIDIILNDDTIKIQDIKILHPLSRAKSNILQQERGDFRL